MRSPLPSLGGVSIRTRDRYFAAGSDGATKDSMSLDCVALVHPTLLLFIEY